jgi:signal transduction histidine kinase
MGQMAAMVAHEVRNPLGILRGQIELLREGLAPRLGAGERDRTAEMLVEIERLRRLTDDFLALGRDVSIETTACDVAAIVEQAVQAVRLSPGAESARLAVDIPPQLTVWGDPARLKQVLLNLLLNAIAMGQDGVRVGVAARRDGRGQVAITVTDDGPGIPEGLRDSLFKPFVTARRGGSGLGLVIARRIAELHGGSLVLEPTSAGARGAAFVLRVPARKGQAWPGF